MDVAVYRRVLWVRYTSIRSIFRPRYIRPGAAEFIQRLQMRHDVALWTTAMEHNALRMLAIVGVDPNRLKFVWAACAANFHLS